MKLPLPNQPKRKEEKNNINAQQIKPNTLRSSSRRAFLSSGNSGKLLLLLLVLADGIFIYAYRKNVVKKFYDQTLHFMCFYVKLPYNIGNIVS